VEQIADWLAKLGLGQYAKVFADNDIDVSVLPHLRDKDLKDLGISLGHRRKIFAAINEGFAAVQPLAEADRAEEHVIQETPERRYVTVLFSDLVGSTALSTRLDPEDLRDVIAIYQRCVEETVRRFDGFVAKFLGDGVLVYFGYPEAHEDDPERAVRAGLELVAAVKGLQAPEPLEARVGIATGLVVVGDLIGSGASQEHSIVGKTPNLAARLQGIAAPSTVVIADSTRKLVGNLFELEDLGGKDLKGIEAPERVWAVLRANLVDSRFDAFQTSGVTELVGRQEELELLQRRWTKAVTGEGQVVLLSGEPGIGKSRLTAALLERLSTEPHTRLRYFCSPQHTDSVLYPIVAQMERAARFAHDDPAQTKLEKLDALLSQSFTPPQDRALFAELLSLRSDSLLPKLDLTPQQRRERTFEALTTQIASLAEQRPVLMIFEDIHWIDPTSLEALGRGIDRIKSVSVLLIITHRTEFEPPWLGRPYVTALGLNRLGKREIASMIDHVAGNQALPETMRQDIIGRTDGIPLFVEEMTRAVLEAESEVDGRKTVTAFPSSAIAVPASLHAYLMARLDRLGPAREVAQIGAAIGREFSHALLAAVALKDEKALQSALDALTSSGLLFQQGVTPNATYLFKHALVQDAAYGTLLREPRRALHARIAETLESKFSEIADNQPEVLARHCTEAGLIEKAARLWGKAGQWSLERSALVEAAEQLQRALHQISTLPITTALRREQIKLQIGLMTALVNLKGYAAPETKAAEERALSLIQEAEALGEPPEDPLLLFSVLHGVWWANYVALNGVVMRELAAQLLGLAEKRGATTPLMIGHRVMGNSLLHAGNIAECRVHFDQAIAFYDPDKHRSLVTRFGQDMKVIVLSWRALALWLLGYHEAALADANEAIRYAREIGHAATLMYALGIAPLVVVARGDYATADLLSDEVIALADQKGALFWKVFGMRLRGQCLACTGRAAQAVKVLTATANAYRSTGSTALVPLDQLYFAKAYTELGQFADASSCIDEAMATLEKNKDRLWEAEALRLSGEIALMEKVPSATKAEAHFERALSVARQQQAKSWELRASMSLARLWRDQGKVQQARELLAPVYGWFTEGFETHDLKEAKALLEELAS
jgi:class 3 adenylate cyclase/predicted ATPase